MAKPKACFLCPKEGHRVGRQGRVFCSDHYDQCVLDLRKQNIEIASKHGLDRYAIENMARMQMMDERER